MANFDPGVPEQNQQQYTHYFQAIQPPIPNVSGETIGRARGRAFAELGQDIERSANLGAGIVQDYIGSNMSKDYHQLTENRVQQLAQLDDVIQGRKPEQSLLTPTSQLPPGLAPLRADINNLNAIRDSGKVSDTYFDMMKDNIAKKYRSEFPGMRDYIDTEFMHITWRDPANKVLQSMEQDINAYVGAQKEARNQLKNRLLSSVLDGDISPNTYQGWEAGKVSDTQIMELASRRKALKNNLEIEDLRLRNLDMKNKLTAQIATQHNNDALSKDGALTLQEMTINIPSFSKDPVKLSEAMNGIASGKIPTPNEQESINIARQGEWARQAWVAKMIQEGNKVPEPTRDNPNPKSRADYMGNPQTYAEMVEKKSHDIFDPFIKPFSVGDLSLAAAHKTQVEAVTDDTTASVLKGVPEIPFAAAGIKLFGNNSKYATDWFNQFTTNPNLVEHLRSWSMQHSTRAVTQFDGLGTSNTYFTLKDVLNDAKAKGIHEDPNGAEAIKIGVIDPVRHTITDSQAPDENRMNAARSIYTTPDLLDLIKKSEMRSDGTVTPGRDTLLGELVNDKITQDIKRFGDPVLYNKYLSSSMDFITSKVRDDFILLNDALKDPGVQLRWDSDNQHQGLRVDLSPEYIEKSTYMPRPYLHHPAEAHLGQAINIRDAVTKFNLAMPSIKTIADATGQPIDTVMLKLMQASGINIKDPDQPIIKALIMSREQQKTETP